MHTSTPLDSYVLEGSSVYASIETVLSDVAARVHGGPR